MGYRYDITQLKNASTDYSQDIQQLQADVEELQMGTALALKYDQDADPPTVAYLGTALPGTASSAPNWRIQKLTFSAGGDVTCTWADGNANFDNVWDNRAGLTYT